MFEKLKARYLKYYITDTQLDRYAALGVLTDEQVTEIKALRNVEAISSVEETDA